MPAAAAPHSRPLPPPVPPPPHPTRPASRSCASATVAANDDAWRTLVHEPGYCATYGICGHRADGDPLSCANNTAAQPLVGGTAAKLAAVCPQLAADVVAGGGPGRVCCTEEQLDQLQKQVGGWVGDAR